MQIRQHGFGITAVFIVMVVVGVLGAGGWYVLNKQNEQSSMPSSTETMAQAPQDRSTQLDVSYKNDMSRLIAAINQSAADDNGKVPAILDLNDTFINQYLDGKFLSPNTGNPYVFVASNPQADEIQYQPSATCETDNSIVSGSSRQVAVRILLSNNAYYCIKN